MHKLVKTELTSKGQPDEDMVKSLLVQFRSLTHSQKLLVLSIGQSMAKRSLKTNFNRSSVETWGATVQEVDKSLYLSSPPARNANFHIIRYLNTLYFGHILLKRFSRSFTFLFQTWKWITTQICSLLRWKSFWIQLDKFQSKQIHSAWKASLYTLYPLLRQ